jgi:magnesium-protoporphyrin O-methyltransferase
MPTATYFARRARLETYFDRTASDAWSKLTSTAPVSGIRATVRAGRDRMRNTLLGWLPTDLRGARVLDAGCGTGALAVEAAKRGANVVAIDLSPTLIAVAHERIPSDHGALGGSISFHAGDMLDSKHGAFDYVVAMDSLIHYRSGDLVQVLAALADRTTCKVLFTFAPKTAALTVMHTAGKLFPKADRAPAIEPVAEGTLSRKITEEARLKSWRARRTLRIVNGFYTSQAMELVAR